MGFKTGTALPLLCLLATAVTAHPHPPRQERRAARHQRYRMDTRENNLFFSLASGLTSFNQAIVTLKAEYSRQIRGGLYWGTCFSARLHGYSPTTYDWSGHGPSPYRNTVEQNIYKADGMLFYRFGIISDRLYLRIGAGAGVGYHRIREIDDISGYDDRVLPYINFEAAWILRISRGFEMKFSPTLALVPSEYAFSPGRLGAPTDVTPWLTDAGFSLTFGWRF